MTPAQQRILDEASKNVLKGERVLGTDSKHINPIRKKENLKKASKTLKDTPPPSKKA